MIDDDEICDHINVVSTYRKTRTNLTPEQEKKLDHARRGHLPHDSTCEVCIRSRMRAAAKQENTYVAESFGDKLSADTLGPVSSSRDGNKYAFVGVDHHTRWLETLTAPAKITAYKFLSYWITLNGPVKIYRTDGAGEFSSDLHLDLVSYQQEHN